MADTPFPYPKETRETDILIGTGVAEYGPFGFKIFDAADVVVLTKPAGQDLFSEVSADIFKVSGASFDDFTIDFGQNIPPETQFIVRSERVHEREIGVTKGGAISTVELEKELSKQGTVVEELRRDINQGVRADYGGDGIRLALLPEGHFWKSDADGNMVDGGNSDDINQAQSHAATAATAAAAAAAAAEATVAAGNAAENWAIRPEDDPVPVSSGGDGASTFSALHWAKKAASNAAPAAGIKPYGTRAEIKALNIAEETTAYLKEAGRECVFIWRSGDYSTEIAADTLEAIYIKADAVAATSGAWVRSAGYLVEGISLAWGEVVNDGVTDVVAKINAILFLAALIGAPSVKASGDGTYLVGSTVVVPGKVQFLGNRLATIKQADGANLTNVVSLGDSAHFKHWIADGNRAGNTDNNNNTVVRVGESHDVVVQSNIIKNSTGYGVVANTGERASVCENTIFNFFMHAVAAYAGPPDRRVDHKFDCNFIHTIGWGAFIVSNCEHFSVSRNIIKGEAIGGRTARLHVDVNGSSVVRVSGPDFTSLKPGNFIVVNGGQEYRIASVDSATNLSLETAAPTLSNVEAGAGPGDLIGVIACRHGVIERNEVSGSSTFGMGLSLGGGSTQCSFNALRDNIITESGKNAINVSYDGGSAYLENNSIIGNKIINAGWGGGIGMTDRIAIFIHAGAPGKNENVLVDNNTVQSYSGTGQTSHWLGVDGAGSFGSVRVGRGNASLGVANEGVYNDVQAIGLAAGFGSGAWTSNIISHGHSVRFTVNTSGAGFSLGPLFNVEKICTSEQAIPMLQAKVTSVSGGNPLTHVWGEHQSTQGAWRANYEGTPVNGGTINITMAA